MLSKADVSRTFSASFTQWSLDLKVSQEMGEAKIAVDGTSQWTPPGREVHLSPLIRLGVPISLVSFLLVVLSGSLMFLAHAREFVASPLFVYKIGFIMLLLINAAALHLRTAGHRGDSNAYRLGGLGHIQVALSIFGWLSVIGMGRWLAYV